MVRMKIQKTGPALPEATQLLRARGCGQVATGTLRGWKMLTVHPPLSCLALGLQSGGFQPLLGQFRDEHPLPPWLDSLVFTLLLLFFFSLLIFIYLICYCKIFASHYCVVSAVHQRESAAGGHVFPRSRVSLPPPAPSHPSVLSKSPGWSSLLDTANSHRLSVLHVVMGVFPATLSVRPTLSLPHRAPTSLFSLSAISAAALQIRSSAASF